MDKLSLTNAGGHPITLDDLAFLYRAIEEAMQGLTSFLNVAGNQTTILSGCEITEGGGNFTYTAGFIMLGNEVFYVPAKVVGTPVPGVPGNYYVHIDETITAKTYKNGAVVNTRFRRTASILATTFSVYDLTNAKRLREENLLTLGAAWITVGGGGGAPAYAAGWSGTMAFRFNKATNKVEFDGASAHAAMGAGNRTIFQLPASHRPAVDTYFTVACLDNAVDTVLILKVESATGDVIVVGGTNGVSKDIRGNQVNYYL